MQAESVDAFPAIPWWNWQLLCWTICHEHHKEDSTRTAVFESTWMDNLCHNLWHSKQQIIRVTTKRARLKQQQPKIIHKKAVSLVRIKIKRGSYSTCIILIKNTWIFLFHEKSFLSFSSPALVPFQIWWNRPGSAQWCAGCIFAAVERPGGLHHPLRPALPPRSTIPGKWSTWGRQRRGNQCLLWASLGIVVTDEEVEPRWPGWWEGAAAGPTWAGGRGGLAINTHFARFCN